MLLQILYNVINNVIIDSFKHISMNVEYLQYDHSFHNYFCLFYIISIWRR